MKSAAFLGIICCLWLGQAEGAVEVTIKKLALTLKNDYFQIDMNGQRATALYINGTNVIKNNMSGKTSFYISYSDGKANTFKPTVLKLLNQTKDFVHVAYYQDSTIANVTIEQHLLVRSDISGFYQYVVYKNEREVNYTLQETRVLCRFDPSIMSNVHNGKISMKPPLYATLAKYTQIQDETWQLPDGSYYSKYDLAGYVRERNFFGVYGGGFGAWFIHPSHEYYSGGPLKQDLIVHQDSLMATYMTGQHFGTPSLTMESGFEKMYGPWLVYFNTGSDSALISSVEKQAKAEIGKWPYSFINDARYQLQRGTVKGTVHGKKSMVVLSPPNEEFDLQTDGYSYHAEANNGAFSIAHVRPGTYLVSVYPIEGASAGTLLQSTVTVTAGHTVNVDTFTIKEPSDVIWQIGEADRRSSEFKYSKEKRNYKWQLMPPADLTFKVGTDDYAEKWYYAQTKSGTWTIEFTDTADKRNREILFSIAGASRSGRLNVSFNGKSLATVGPYDNDSASYRSAIQSGNYHYQNVTILASRVKTGTNTLAIRVPKGAIFYDCIVYTRV